MYFTPTGAGARAGRREVHQHVRADHDSLLDRAHRIDLVEPTARHQYIIRGSQ
jgi:hypothetical protein